MKFQYETTDLSFNPPNYLRIILLLLLVAAGGPALRIHLLDALDLDGLNLSRKKHRRLLERARGLGGFSGLQTPAFGLLGCRAASARTLTMSHRALGRAGRGGLIRLNDGGGQRGGGGGHEGHELGNVGDLHDEEVKNEEDSKVERGKEKWKECAGEMIRLFDDCYLDDD